MPTRTCSLFRDHHSHPFLYAATRDAPDLRGAADAEAAFEILSGCDQPLNMALGWNDALYDIRGERFEQLPPFAVFNASLHGLVMNRGGRNALNRLCPDLVTHVEDPVWMEAHAGLLLRLICDLSPVSPAALAAFYDHLAETGVWAAEEMSLSGKAEIDCFQAAGLTGRTRFWADPEIFMELPVSSRNDVYGIKLFTDGSIGTRTAALLEPFDQNHGGVLNYSDICLDARIAQAYEWGKAVAIHAIGDRALEQTVTVLELLRDKNGTYPETRIEHAQFINRDQAHRLLKMGCRLSMQPNFSQDSIAYAERLSPAAARKNNPFRMLIDDIGFVPGKDLLFGSDGMPHGAEAALVSALFPPYKGQVLSIDELVAGYTAEGDGAGQMTLEVDPGAKIVRILEINRPIRS